MGRDMSRKKSKKLESFMIVYPFGNCIIVSYSQVKNESLLQASNDTRELVRLGGGGCGKKNLGVGNERKTLGWTE